MSLSKFIDNQLRFLIITHKRAIQIFAIFTPIILAYHNSTKDRKPTASEKKFFYYFYPIPLAGLAALKAVI